MNEESEMNKESRMNKETDNIILKIGDLPDEIILEIINLLKFKDINQFRQTNKFHYSLISIDDYIPNFELSDNFIELHFNRSLLDDKNFSELIVEDNTNKYEVRNKAKNDIIIKKDEILIRCYTSFTNFTEEKLSPIDIKDNLRIFVDSRNSQSARDIYIYTNKKFVISTFEMYPNEIKFRIFNFNNTIEKIFWIFDYGSRMNNYYIFTKTKMTMIEYNINMTIMSIKEYKFVREINPNLYIYLNGDNLHVIISRYKKHIFIIINELSEQLAHIYKENYYFKRIEFDTPELREYKEYVENNNQLIDRVIKENLYDLSFIQKCREISKYLYDNKR